MVNDPENNNKHEFVGKTVILAADLDLSDHYWECIGQKRSDGISFSGTFLGNGHTISGINVVNTGAYNNDEVTVGLFALAKNATIKNLTIANSCFLSKGCDNIALFCIFITKKWRKTNIICNFIA